MKIEFQYDTDCLPKKAKNKNKRIMMVRGGKCFFVVNASELGEFGRDQNQGVNEYMAALHPEFVRQLTVNRGDYFMAYGLHENPFDLLCMVKENRYQLKMPRFEIVGSKAAEGCYFNFDGRVHEITCPFHYRIYSHEYAVKLRDAILDTPMFSENHVWQIAPIPGSMQRNITYRNAAANEENTTKPEKGSAS